MKKVLLLFLALVILYLLMRRSSSGYDNQFVAACPPGSMPAGGECVPYYF